MHNCKQAQKHFEDLALNEMPRDSAALLEELNGCPVCREEFARLTSVLHVSNQALKATLPDGEFWSGYHATLKTKLVALDQAHETRQTPSFFKLFATSSIRLPVPVALAAVLLFGALFAVLLKRANAKVNSTSPAVLVETKTVEVPVVQEKTVTRVVYVARKERRGRAPGLNLAPPDDALPATFATISPNARPLNLSGFKPTDEVKMTIIKGTYDEK